MQSTTNQRVKSRLNLSYPVSHSSSPLSLRSPPMSLSSTQSQIFYTESRFKDVFFIVILRTPDILLDLTLATPCKNAFDGIKVFTNSSLNDTSPFDCFKFSRRLFWQSIRRSRPVRIPVLRHFMSLNEEGYVLSRQSGIDPASPSQGEVGNDGMRQADIDVISHGIVLLC